MKRDESNAIAFIHYYRVECWLGIAILLFGLLVLIVSIFLPQLL